MKNVFIILFFCASLQSIGQSSPDWIIEAKAIDPNNYYGVTVANGMIGLVSSPEPMKVKDVVLNGVYDYYQRGRVSNILKTFNHVNMNLEVDSTRISLRDISNYRQVLDMKKAALTTTFDVGNKVSETYHDGASSFTVYGINNGGD